MFKRRVRDRAAEAAYVTVRRVSTPPGRRWWLRLAAAGVVVLAGGVLVPAVRGQAFLAGAALLTAALVTRNVVRP